MDRRSFSQKLIAGIVSHAFIGSLMGAGAVQKPIRPITDHWAKRLNEYCMDLQKSAVTPLEWQTLVEDLYRNIQLEEVIRFIDLEGLLKGFELPDLGTGNKYVRFPTMSGLPENTIFVKKIFGLKKNRAIIPHGHSNMTSAHLIVKGEMHLRNYDKVGEEEQFLQIKPTVDQIISPGKCSTISDEKDNIHWFVANTDQAFTFDVIMLDLNNRPYDIHNIDIYEKTSLGDGTWRVPKLDVDTALKKYGKMHH